MTNLVARTNIKPNYTDYLYYCKNGGVWSYNKKTRQKKQLASSVFHKKEGHGYVLKRDSGGHLVVVERSLASMRVKARAKRSANARKRKIVKDRAKAKKKAAKKKRQAKRTSKKKTSSKRRRTTRK